MMCWVEGMNAKLYGNGKPFGRSEFDKLLGNYNVRSPRPPVLDLKTDCFYETRLSLMLHVQTSPQSLSLHIPMPRLCSQLEIQMHG